MVYYHLGLFIPRALQVRTSIGLGNGGHWPHFWPVWLLIPWAIIALGGLGRRR